MKPKELRIAPDELFFDLMARLNLTRELCSVTGCLSGLSGFTGTMLLLCPRM